MDHIELWDKAKALMREELANVSYTTWIEQPLKPVYVVDNKLALEVISDLGKEAVKGLKEATADQTKAAKEAAALAEAEEILDTLCEKPVLEKTRHYLHFGNHLWEIDEFAGDNAGLIVAEIELSRVDEPFARPDWLGEEVSHDIRYYNSQLARHPYRKW